MGARRSAAGSRSSSERALVGWVRGDGGGGAVTYPRLGARRRAGMLVSPEPFPEFGAADVHGFKHARTPHLQY